MLRTAPILVFAVACSFPGSAGSGGGGAADAAADADLAPDAAPDAPAMAWFDPFLARRPITVDNSARPFALADFPLLVRLPALGAGLDIGEVRFVADDHATELEYEIEQWQPKGISTAWVKTTIAASSTPRFWVYYGADSAQPDHSNPASVFTDFEGVYHFSDAYGGSPTQDSSPGNRDLAATNLDSTDDAVAGNTGAAVEIDRGALEFFESQGVINEFRVGDLERRSYEAWFRTGEVDTFFYTILDTELGCQGIAIEIDAANSDRLDAIFDVGPDCVNRDAYVVESADDIDDGEWHHVAVVVDRLLGGVVLLYIDGVLVDSATGVPMLGNTGGRELRIGEDGDSGAQAFDGLIDEVRVGPARGFEWWDATVASQSPAQTMVTVGAEQTR